jgi:7-cyano-7-deazaguanine synthase in queuosine biosynthesis
MPETQVEARVGASGRRSRFSVATSEGPRQTFRLSAEKIAAKAQVVLDDVSLDFMELACAVFAADGFVRRGGDARSDFGAAWRREFAFQSDVRRADVWRRDGVAEAIVDAVEFLSDDVVSFAFEQFPHRIPSQPYFPEGIGAPFKADAVVLFSGGLDSFAGALEALATTDENIVLVTHRSAQKAIPRQEALGKTLNARFFGRVHHVQVTARRRDDNSSERTQRTRSFLFAALGYAVARAYGAPVVRFYENGVVSCNLPISPQVIGTMATRTTHPGTLARLQTVYDRLSAAAGQAPIRLENPYGWLTKTEVVERIAVHGGQTEIATAVSCTSLRTQSTDVTHCGACSQCLDRRFALVAAGLEDHDPSEAYETDVFLGARDEDRSRTMAVDWTRRSIAVAEDTFIDFLARHMNELQRIVAGYPNESQNAVLGRLHELHVRHGCAARAALRRVFAAQSAPLADGVLPTTSLLRLWAADGRAVVVEPSAPPPVRAVVAVNRTQVSLRDSGDRLLPLQVEFTQDRRGPIVSVRELGDILADQALLLHRMKPKYDEDIVAALSREKHRYSRPVELLPDRSKEAVKMLVARCRRDLRDNYVAIMGEPPPRHLLIESRPQRGYRLDPDIRIVKPDRDER